MTLNYSRGTISLQVSTCDFICSADGLLQPPRLRTHSKRPHLSVVKFLKNKVLQILNFFLLPHLNKSLYLLNVLFQQQRNEIMKDFFNPVKPNLKFFTTS